MIMGSAELQPAAWSTSTAHTPPGRDSASQVQVLLGDGDVPIGRGDKRAPRSSIGVQSSAGEVPS